MAQTPDFKLSFNNLTNYVPVNLRNQVITSLIDNLFNRHMTHDESIPLYGYIGRKPVSPDDKTPAVPQLDGERDINAVIPVLSFSVGSETELFTVQDLINKAEAIGVSDASPQWLYSQGNNYAPPIDFDKFTNFFNYYWVASAVPATPVMPWNTELLPEYYTIATPQPADLNKLNVVAATTQPITLTGVGFQPMSFTLVFSTPTTFTMTPEPDGVLGNWTPVQTTFSIQSNDDKFSYIVAQPGYANVTLLTFEITRQENFDQFGVSTGLSTFLPGDTFTITPTFLTRNYTVSFKGAQGNTRGKIANVKPLDVYQTIDGVVVRSGDRVLVKNNSVTEDGIYVVGAGAWTPATDFDGATRVAGAKVYVKSGVTNGSKLFESIDGLGGIGWVVVPGVTDSNTNQWQEGNYWVHGDDLAAEGLTRADVTQAVRPIIEYSSDLQLNSYVQNGAPSDTGTYFRQVKTEFNQLPLFDLFRYDGTHSGYVSSVFYYEEDPTADLDLQLQKRPLISTNESADFVFNHGMMDPNGQLLFVKRSGVLKTIWHAGYSEPTVVDQQFSGTGNGALVDIVPADLSQQQIWTITATSATTFSVTGSKLGESVVTANVGIEYANDSISFLITAGSIPFEADDTFIMRVGSLESPRYVSRDSSGAIYDFEGGALVDISEVGAWQLPRTFYNNPYNESQAQIVEGVLYSHFQSILANQPEGFTQDNSFGGSIKLWSEQQTLLASLLMQRDLTPISMIDLAERQYEVALNTMQDIFKQKIVQYIGNSGAITTIDQLDDLLSYIESIRTNDNDVRTVLYDSTAALVGFPATLPQLGILPLVQPTIGFDEILGRTLLTHHDGHKSTLFIDDLDFRTSILGNLTTLMILRSDGTYTNAIGSFTTMPASPYKGELWIDTSGTMRTYNVVSDGDAPSVRNTGDFWYKRSANTLYQWDGIQWVQQSSITAPWTVINIADTLNSLMLRIEQKLYLGINPNARKFDFSALLSNSAFQTQVKNELFSFSALNGYDPLGPDYSATDAFTWNYSQGTLANFAALNVSKVPARWYNVLLAHQATVSGVVLTARPNLEPWKLFGFTDQATWWASLDASTQASYTPIVQLSSIGSPTVAVKAVSTTGGITALTGLQTIDGVVLNAGDKVLLTAETAPANNGIWVVGMATWSRDLTPLVPGLVISITAGQLYKGTTWYATSGTNFGQARTWTNQLWADVQAAKPTLHLSVDTINDTLLPPYVAGGSVQSVNALTNFIPPGVSLGYNFNEGSPVETIWRASSGYGYSLARALFRFDPLAFLGFCWGFNWVEVDGILYDGFDMNMPGHKRFRLHGDAIGLVTRSPMLVTGSTGTIVATYTAYDTDRTQNFTVTQNGVAIGYAQVGVPTVVGGYSFTLLDEGRPFRIGDRFEIVNGVVTFVPIATYRYMGFGQTFTHALREVSIDTSSSFAISAYREWDVNMGYRAGGLVATDDLEIFTESLTLSPVAYSLLFKKNPIASNEWVQALRISVTQFGQVKQGDVSGYAPVSDGADWIFKIEGYNPRYLELSYYQMDTTTALQDFYALSQAHTDLAWTTPTVPLSIISTTLPLTITGIQNVVNFLFGYAAYLEERGWEFNAASDQNIDAETGRTRNFQLEVEKFVDRCYAGLSTGEGHVVNPFLDRAWFNQDTGLMSEFFDSSLFDVTGNPGVFDVLGVKYQKSDLDVQRGNLQSSFGAAGPMYSAHIQIDNFEHLFVFNNFAEPSTSSSVLFDPFSGARVVTYKFNGRKQASATLRPEFGGHYLQNHQVRQNIQASADNFGNFYDPNHAFENETTSRHALALLGFSTKSYFDDLDISEKTQFNFWRGLIQAKGTNMSVDAYLNNNRFDDAKIDEYWAYKVATYGDARQRTFPELKLSVNDALTQFTQLQFDNDSLSPSFTTITNYDETRWFSIDDLNLTDNTFAAEVVGTYVADVTPGQITLPFIADLLIGLPSTVTQLNATTLQVNSATSLNVTGYGPARPRFNPVKLFNYAAEELIAEIPVWHPAVGQHTPTALECINIISDLNPAKYNYSTQVVNNNTYDPLRPWGVNEVGRVWLDTTNLAYVPYYDASIYTLDQRLSRWGTLADYASIDVYEWIQSSVPPSEFNALALTQAGDASLDPNTKAAGQVALEQTYVRNRNWSIRPVAWSYSGIPMNTDFDWGTAGPPFVGGAAAPIFYITTDSTNGIVASLEYDSFADIGITAGMHIGEWNYSLPIPKPVSEYLINDTFMKTFVATETLDNTTVSVVITSTNDTSLTGTLAFFATGDTVIRAVADEGEDSVDVLDSVVVNTDGTLASSDTVVIPFAALGFSITVTIKTTVTSPTALRDAIVDALGAKVTARNAVTLTEIVGNGLNNPQGLSNDADYPVTPHNGWRAWAVPTQAQLTADGTQPVASWVPYVGDYVPITASLAQIQDAIAYAKAPLTLNDGTVIDRYSSTWSDWNVLKNIQLTEIPSTTGAVTFTNTTNFDATNTSVYVNGLSQLKATFTISGKTLTVTSVPAGSRVDVIILKYEPTATELAFDPTVNDNLAYQQQYKEDYEYVSLPTRDTDGSLSSTIYFFWVQNKTTVATGKALSVQSVAQELRDGPDNFLTFQNIHNAGTDLAPNYVYDAITISGLSYLVTKDDTFKLRFTRNFTLRDDPEEWNLKDVHTEWSLMRPGQKTLIPEGLWQKLTDSVAGQDAAGNAVPALRRVLYDERNSTATQFGFGAEQTLAPSDLLASSISYTIVNTSLVDTSGATPVPDYITFLDFDQSETWFATAGAARATMTAIWNQAKVSQVNEIFFAALNDVVASNYELTDIFKTSRLSAYSIKTVTASPVAQTYE